MPLTEIQMNMIIVIVSVALCCVVPSSGFAIGDLVTCNLCRPFAGDTVPKECEMDSEFGVQCPLCYQLSGPDDLLSEICVPISNYMTIMSTVIQPELELCWLKNQGNCILRLVGPVSSSSPTITPLPASTEPGPSGGNCSGEEHDGEASTVVEDEIVEDSAVEDNDVADDSIEGDATEDDDAEAKVVPETLDEGTEGEDTTDEETPEEDTALFEEIFVLFIDDEDTSEESTVEE